jgi:hypothetical protein
VATYTQQEDHQLASVGGARPIWSSYIDSSWIHWSARSFRSDSSWMHWSARRFCSKRNPHSVGRFDSSWMHWSARRFCSKRDPHSVGRFDSSWMHGSARRFCYNQMLDTYGTLSSMTFPPFPIISTSRGSSSDLPGLIRTGQPLFQQLVQKNVWLNPRGKRVCFLGSGDRGNQPVSEFARSDDERSSIELLDMYSPRSMRCIASNMPRQRPLNFFRPTQMQVDHFVASF